MNEYCSNRGYIEVITGPMFAGKTEELIRRVKRLIYAKKKVLIFKPVIDDRYSEDEIVSHANSRVKSIVISKASEILEFLEDDCDAVVIDEVQFLGEEVGSIVDILASKGIRVICGGLDMDFKGEPFGVMPTLLAKAEEVTKLTAICTKCGLPATRTQRIINGLPASYNDPLILVGAVEAYEPRCRHCHEVLNKPRG